MTDYSSKTFLSYILECLYWTFLAYFWYDAVFFRPVPGHEHNESYLILRWSAFLLCVVGIALSCTRRRNFLNLVITVLGSYVPYFALSFLPIARGAVIAVVVLAGVVSVCYCLLVSVCFFRDRYRGRHRLPVWRCINACLLGSRCLSTALLGVLMLVTAAKPLFGIPVTALQATVSATDDGQQGITVSANMPTLLLLQEDEWVKLDTMQRLNVMKTVSDIEADRLGIPSVPLRTDTLAPAKLAHYIPDERVIELNLTALESMSARIMLHAICHETYHAYQFAMVDLYEQLNPQEKELFLFRDVARYKQEFENYVSGIEDYEAYSQQLCETHCDDYAGTAVNRYDVHIRARLISSSDP